MNSEKLNASTIEQNIIEGEQSRVQTKNIGKKVLDSNLESDEIDYVPEGYLTADALSRLIGVSSRTIDLKIKELRIERSGYKDERNVKCLFLSPEQQQQIRDSLDYLMSAEKAPDGYLTARSFAGTIGVNRATIGKKIKELEIEGTEYKDKRGIICSFLSPEQQQQIRDSLDYLISAEDAPDGYLAIKPFAEKNNISKQAINKSLKELQITGEEYKDGRGVINSFLSPEQQQVILEHLKNRIDVGKEPEGYLSADYFAHTIGVDWATVKKKMKDLQIEGTEYKDKRGVICSFLSPEQQQQIRDSLDYLISTEKAPDGYITINKLAKEIGVDKATVRKRINDSQIEVSKFKDKRGIICSFLSPEQQQQIRDLFDNESNIDFVPNGYLTADAFSRELNVGWNVVNAVIDELQIEGIKYKDKRGIICSFLSPEQQQQIRDSLDYLISAKDAPDGYLTARSFAEMVNIDKATVGKRIKDLQIEGTKYKDKRGVICSFLSPEQQSIILESIENMEAGTSISENVVAFYFEKAGQKIKQGLRPDWLKNPATGRNLEIDIFVDSLGVGIEYDGMYWHQDIERDVKKDDIAQKSGYRIIHIREDGCPDLPEDSICIKRKDNSSDDDLGESVKKCFQVLGLPAPDIDVVRDKKDIMAFMRQRVIDKLDSTRTFKELSVAS